MADEYDAKHPDFHSSAGDADNDRPVAEDPLVELARIVHKNKQSGNKVSTGRVGNTDYFAGLDDVSETSEPSPSQAPQRREPAFSGFGSNRSQQQRVEPSISRGGPVEPPHGEMVSEPPASDENVSDRRHDDAEELPPFDVTPYEETQSNPEAVKAPEVAEPAQARPSHVSSLWPKGPSDFGVQSASARVAEPAPAADPEPQAVQPRTHPSVSLDLEQNLTAELEDELIGALRQAVDDHSTGRSPTTQEPSASRAEPAPSSHAYAVSPASRSNEGQAAAPKPPQPQNGPASSGVLPPSFGRPLAATPTATSTEVKTEEVKSAQFEAETDIFADEPARDTRRPAIDESDFLAALSDSQPSGQPVSLAGHGETSAKGDPAGIDALFADLDFPDPAARKPAAAAPQSATESKAYVSSANLDDVAWPAEAVSPVASSDAEDETPPPPEGYDLDAVARAMQESDPSLAGSGVLPPHSRAERAAVPQGGEKSRRGAYVAAGILGVGVLGAAGFFLIDGDAVQVPSGPPPIISGMQDPLKVYPEESDTSSSNQTAKLIYDRVGGEGTSGPERLVLPESPQPAELPPAPADADGSADLLPGTPKRVRTLVVRPDGSIISEDELSTPAAQTPDVATPGAASPGASSESDSVPTRMVTTTPLASDGGALPEGSPDLSPEPALLQGEGNANADAVPTQGEPATAPDELSQPSTAEQNAPVPSALPRKKPEAPVRVANAPAAQAPQQPAQSSAPLDLNRSGNSAPAASAPSSGTQGGSIAPGTYIVQVTSQRSAAAASDAYSGLQRRFPSILGNRNAVIVSADLGDRGVFYRARIPTGSRDEADSLCQSLQGAGGDCFVRRQP
ncbi:hypothetical protein FMN50_23050 [Rhodobacterales bacterium]|nr:hypothetical protein FMN50_23050 [Rhodobacterales bacterium]